MSGDVQPRKRKDKKRKKDDLTIEEHRGTAAVFGEGDVLMHSHHEHGTGGHWCAKIIFFSLLAVLVTLIGLIILENRGLSELEANAVQSSYSGVLDGWIEDAPDDDHHDEHTLELKHHGNIGDDEDEHGSDNGHDLEFDDNDDELGDDDDEHDDEDDESEEFDEQEIDHDDDEVEQDDEDEEDDSNLSREVDADDDDADQQEDDDDEANEVDEDEDDRSEEQNAHATKASQAYNEEDGDEDDDEDDDDDNISQGNEHDDDNESEEHAGHNNDVSKEVDENDNDDDDGGENNNQSAENDNELDEHDDDENSKEEQDDEDDEEHEDDHEEEPEEEIEKIEKEVTDEEEPETTEPPVPDVSVEKEEEDSVEVLTPNEIDEVDDSDFLEADDLDEPAVERIAPPPPGKPYDEIDEAVSTEVPSNILAEEEEYEKQQEHLRQEEAQSTDMWLKLAVGGALLAATHAVVRRATAPRDAPESEVEEHDSREETPVVDRRMTLIQDEPPKLVPPPSLQPEVEEEVVQKSFSSVKAAPVSKQESEEVEEDVQLDEEVEEDQEVQETKDKELYSDEDEIEADEEVDEEIEEKVEAPKSVPKVAANLPKVAAKKEEESEPEEDVEIIEEEVEEEVEDEEEISDVDDTELLSRLEAKYGRLPEPDRPGQRHKDGGNNVEDDWPGEPSDAFWREQLHKAEQELRQDWLD